MSTRILAKTMPNSFQKRKQAEPYHISVFIQRMQAQMPSFGNKSGQVLNTIELASQATLKLHEHFRQTFVQAAKIVSINEEKIILTCSSHAHASKLKQFIPSILNYLNSIGFESKTLEVHIVQDYASH